MAALRHIKKMMVSMAAVSLIFAFTAAAAEKTKIKFYGKIVEYDSGVPMIEALQSRFMDKYDIEGIQVDWGNLDKVIRVGIASGEPADVYQYWPQAISRFVESGMALDLTPYLEANGGVWKKTFIASALETGKVNGKYYALPLNSNFSLIIANKALFAKAGVAIPEVWNWDEFLSACQKLKKSGVFPFGNATDNARADWFYRNGMLSTFKTAGKLEDLIANKIPATDPLWLSVLVKTKALYDDGYMYPGKGAVTVKTDEIKAAFYHGKIAMMAEIAAGASTTIKESGFETVVLAWPSMSKENAVLGGCDGVFIPVNAPHKEEAIELLKAYLGRDIQEIHANAGLPIVNNGVRIKDPVTKRVVQISSSIEVREFGLSLTKVYEYTSKVLLGELVLGKGPRAVQSKMEEFRKELLAVK